MKISREEVSHIAALAHLRIDETEREKWSEQMGAIIAFADQLNELSLNADVATEDLENGPVNVFREDVRKPSAPREEILANAPQQLEGCYAVPRVVD